MRKNYVFLLCLVFIQGDLWGQIPDPTKSTVSVSPSVIPVSGTATITVQLKDAGGNNITTGGQTITFVTPSTGTIGTTMDNNNGTYTAIYTASNTTGNVVITPKLGSTNFTNTATVTIIYRVLDGTSGNNSITENLSTIGNVTIGLGFFVDYLIVGGGGGGGYGGGGGGGGGGFLEGTMQLDNSNYSVSVGTGGAGGTSSTSSGGNGLDSEFNSMIAKGGGGGGNTAIAGMNGGSGGGGGGQNTTGGSATQASMSGVQSFGNNGGGGYGTGGGGDLRGGGGGGAGAAGGAGSISAAGNGGDGRASTIKGSSVTYAGGGGGGRGSSISGGALGGSGGGGNGGQGSTVPTAGADGYGGGGGGGGSIVGGLRNGANGGSGVVIIRYAGASLGSIGGSPIASGTGTATGTTLHNFTPTTLTPFFNLSSVDFNSRLGATLSGKISGTGNLTYSGPGRLTLSGANDYTGSTTISASTLRLGANNSIPNTALNIASGATFDLSGYNEEVGSIAGSGTIISASGTPTLICGSDNTSTTFSGVIGSGVIALTKKGSGTLTLSGSNTYTGATTVSAGTLQLNRTGGTTIPSTNNVTVSGGILKVSTSQELNNLSVTSGSLVVDAGVTLTINGTFTGGGTITNNGTIVIKGSSTFPGSTTTISAMNNLTVDRSGGVVFNKDMDVTGTLAMATGIIDIGTTTLTVSGTISGATSAKYIKTSSTGGLKQSVINSAISFPVGNSAYNPVTLTNNTGVSDNFTVRVIDEVYTDGTSSGTTVSTLRVKRTWDITKTTPSANSGNGVDMVFNWTPASHTSGTLAIPKLYHYESSNWVKKSITTNTTYDVVAGTLTFTGYKGDFSPFAIMDDGAALPVTWLSFTGRAIHGEVELNWSTASEQNNSHFEVERSADAILFNKIGRVNAATNPRIRNDYRYLDQQPIAGRSFYRLKQVDLDGKFSYSSIIQINGVVPQGFKAWILPGASKLTLQIPQTITSASTVQLYDASGRLVASKQVLPGINLVDLSRQSGGVYYVRVLQGSLLLYSSSVVK